MTTEIQFKIEGDDTANILSSTRILRIHVNNKFYSQSTIGLPNSILIPNANKSDLALDCTVASSNESVILQKIALNALPIICKITFDNGEKIVGSFFISNYSMDYSTDDIPEISFKLKSSGSYEIT